MPKDKKRTHRDNVRELANYLIGQCDIVSLHQECPNTSVKIIVEHDGVRYERVGFSKVRWPDVWDDEYGIELAVEKAAFAIAKRILPREDHEGAKS